MGGVVCEAEAGELPAGGGWEKVSVGGPDVGGGGDAGAAAEDDLGGHELAVVLAESAGEGAVAGVAGVGGGGPFPNVAEGLLEGGAGVGGDGVEVVGLEQVGGGEGWVGNASAPDRSGVFPFEFGGESLPCPAGEGVGLEEGDVADGGVEDGVEWLESFEGVDGPAGVGVGVAGPVEGRLPAFGAHGGPAFGEPELGAGIGVVVEEGEVFGGGDEAGGEAVGLEEDGVAGGLVIEGEGGGIGGVGGDTDVGKTAGIGEEGGGKRGFGGTAPAHDHPPFAALGGGDGGGLVEGGGYAVGGVERVGEEGVLDVGGDELEVLLLVLEAQGDAAEDLGGDVLRSLGGGGVQGEEMLDVAVDVGAEAEDLGERRAREGGAELFLGHVAEGGVVGVEEPVEVGVKGLVGGDEGGENEGFEEPGGVREVPLDGAGFRRGLDHEVLG